MKKIIIIEGATRCPKFILNKIAERKGYLLLSRTKYEKLKKQGVFQNCKKSIAAIFVGPRPHKIRKGGYGDLQSLEGTTKNGIPVFTCNIFTQNKVVKITKNSFLQAFLRFEEWELHQ
jgi:hypothetical protein